jgi:hypothetical protein
VEGDGEVAGPQAYRKMGLISSMLRIKKTAVQCLVRLAWWWFWYLCCRSRGQVSHPGEVRRKTRRKPYVSGTEVRRTGSKLTVFVTGILLLLGRSCNTRTRILKLSNFLQGEGEHPVGGGAAGLVWQALCGEDGHQHGDCGAVPEKGRSHQGSLSM